MPHQQIAEFLRVGAHKLVESCELWEEHIDVGQVSTRLQGKDDAVSKPLHAIDGLEANVELKLGPPTNMKGIVIEGGSRVEEFIGNKALAAMQLTTQFLQESDRATFGSNVEFSCHVGNGHRHARTNGRLD
jgi:hypothetical protein